MTATWTADQNKIELALAATLDQPGEQAWLNAAHRFRGGAADWNWDPRGMRLISKLTDVDDPETVVYLVIGRGDGGTIDTPPVFTIFTVTRDDIGDPDVFMSGDYSSAAEAATVYGETAEDYGFDAELPTGPQIIEAVTALYR